MPPVAKKAVKSAAKKVAPRAVKAVAPPAGIEVPMERSRETKGTYVYTNDEVDSPIKLLYIGKGTMETEPPHSIVVVIRPA